MKDSVKYIAVDLDGTLLTHDFKILEQTKNALLKVQSKGIKVVIATGRPIKGAFPYADALELEKYGGYILASNGAMIYDCQKKEVIFEDRLSVEDTKRIFAALEKFDIYPFVREKDKMYVEDVYGPYFDTQMSFGVANAYEIEARLGGFLLTEVRSLKEDINFPALKIMAAGKPEYLDEYEGEFDKEFKDIAYCARTAKIALEFIKNGVSKGANLERIGLDPEYLITFGDSMNDIEMIKFAKYGVAMGNAMQNVKDTAFAVTKSNMEDGIFHFLNDNGLLD